jgi:oligoribonuclease (3'-5' exoribonuclease)
MTLGSLISHGYTNVVQRLTQVLFSTRAYMLGLLILWFGTHHLAPGFESRIFASEIHSHILNDEIPQFRKAHSHLEHCEFCGSSTFAVLTLQNNLPRFSQLLLHNVNLEFWIVARVPLTRLARAPPTFV